MKHTATLTLLAVALLAGPAGATDTSAQLNTQLHTAWSAEKLTPAPPVDDARFLRRASIDLTGSLPSDEAVTKFLADTDPAKREKAVDRLLASDGYAKHSADYWDSVLMGRLTRT